MIDVGKIWKQGDPLIARDLLGNSPTTTIWGGGCLLCCHLFLQWALARDRYAWDPGKLNVIMRKVPGAFAPAGGRIDDRRIFAEGCGFRYVGNSGFDLEHLASEIDAGRPMIAGIDYKDGKSSGDSGADHFVAIVGYERGPDGKVMNVFFADPMFGRLSHAPVVGMRYLERPASITELRYYDRALPIVA